jgi:hypothetical protein
VQVLPKKYGGAAEWVPIEQAVAALRGHQQAASAAE